MSKPVFSRHQIISATQAAKNFGEVRRRAKVEPQFISDRNEIDTVVLDYQTYEDMYDELTNRREANRPSS